MKQESASSFLPTRASLLQRLKNSSDEQGWFEFVAIYRNLLRSFCRKAGLTETEADDAVQETLIEVSKHLPNFKYDPNVCSFKTWLLMITRQRISRQLAKRKNPGAAFRGETALSPDSRGLDEKTQVFEDAPLEILWEREWKEHILALAMEQLKTEIRPEHFQILELLIVQNWPPEEVAAALRISRARVYLVKHRLASALKRHVKKFELEELSLRSSASVSP